MIPDQKEKEKASIRPTSRKAAVHQIFAVKGKDAAFLAGRRRRLKASTLSTWFSSWKNPRRRRSA